MITAAQWAYFDSTADAEVARRIRWSFVPPSLRKHIVKHAIANWPTAEFMDCSGRDVATRHITSGPSFKRQMKAAPWAWLLPWVLQIVIGALIEYYFHVRGKQF